MPQSLIAKSPLWLICLLLFVSPARAQDDTTTSTYLISGKVVDDETGEPIRLFRVIPGVPFSSFRQQDGEELAVWQPHLIRQMNDGKLGWPRERGYKRFRLRIEAEGYLPATSEWTGKQEPEQITEIRLRKAIPITCRVVSVDGLPAAGAKLSVSLPNSTVRLQGKEFERREGVPDSLSDWWRIPRMLKCDQEGRVEVPPESDPAAMLCVIHETGYSEAPVEHLIGRSANQSETLIVLQPWARVEGKVIWKDQAGSGETISLSVFRDNQYPGMIESYRKAVADEQGNYRFDYVPPGRVQISHPVKIPANVRLSEQKIRFDYPDDSLNLLPGETKRCDIGGSGVVVTGKITGLLTYLGIQISIAPPAPDTFHMFKFGMREGANDLQLGYEALRKESYAPFYFRDHLPVSSDGSFRIENVMTGKYRLSLTGAAGMTEFNIDSSVGNSLDIGEIKATPLPVDHP